MSLIKLPKKIVRNYIRDYLLNVIKDIEKFSIENSVWSKRPDIIIILTKLLLNSEKIIFDGSVTNSLETLTMFSDFYTLDDLEKYCDSFITQTKPFSQGEINSKPKIIFSLDEDEEVKILNFLNVTNDEKLVISLKRINALSCKLNEYLLTAPLARRDILLSILAPRITPLFSVIETIYGVLNETS